MAAPRTVLARIVARRTMAAMMLATTFRCSLTGETQTEILCAACADQLAPLPADTSEAEEGIECTTCREHTA